jgi:hypothetical protein
MLLLSIFAILTAPKLWQNLRTGRVQSVSPTASIDSLLTSLLEMRDASAQLERSASAIPTTQRIVFISAKNDARCDFVYSAICYLTWPRKIDKVELAPNEPPPHADAAEYVCGNHVDGANAQSLGPNLTLRVP